MRSPIRTNWQSARLNGRMVQEDNTSSMIHKVAELIEYISTFTRLSPGDVIITGSRWGG